LKLNHFIALFISCHNLICLHQDLEASGLSSKEVMNFVSVDLEDFLLAPKLDELIIMFMFSLFSD
jgi:hypothetical protein